MAMKIKVIIDNKKVEKIFLSCRKTLDGNIIIYGHPEIDIFVMPAINKVVATAKSEMDDEIYETQERFFKYLSLKGVIDVTSVQAGNLFMSMEGKIPEVKEKGDKIQYVLYAISNFLELDLPFYQDQKDFEKEMEKSLLEPEPDEYTEYDPDLHDHTKGSIPPRNVPGYGISTIYRL